MTRAPSERPTLLSIYDGRACIGHVVRHAHDRHEALALDHGSLGIFADEETATAVIWRRAHKQECAP
jgi:hypothetical protein